MGEAAIKEKAKIFVPDVGSVGRDTFGNKFEVFSEPLLPSVNGSTNFIIPAKYLDGPFKGVSGGLRTNDINWKKGFQSSDGKGK